MLRKIFHNQNDIQLGQNSSKFQVVEEVWVISSTGESEVQDCLFLTCDPAGHWNRGRAYQDKKPYHDMFLPREVGEHLWISGAL